ncbi:hypothetical protein CBER1_00664 [Cercospora berteroae]|uniref:S-adenosyl-L-methionine-dependent N-methyltransferase n=1 Tax=Cercospora berteroae TaxID=357750 RepID=A0A2S6C981_9PEZI|nr:hypothetical protein CBER1_00664 [Cercospora berteroae]
METVPSLVAFGALAPWPTLNWQVRLRATLKENRALAPIVAAVLELPSLWEVLRGNDKDLDQSFGKAAAEDLTKWLVEDTYVHRSQENRNAITMPITVISHIVQYLEFLRQSDNAVDHASLLEHVAERGGIQGFCAGLLSALAVASASHESDVGLYAESSIRLAFCAGVYVDLDQERSTGFTKLAVRWPRGTLCSTIEQVLAKFSETYISVLRDERDATITCPEPALKPLQEALAREGVSTRDTGSLGRYHHEAYKGIPERILKVCGPHLEPAFTNVSLVLSNTDGTPFQENNVVIMALRSLLEDQANWHDTMSKAAATLTAADSGSYVLGIGMDAIPQSVARRAHTRKMATNTAELTDVMPPRTHRASISFTPSINGDNPKHAIAVTGMACKFPGADSVDEFWSLLLEKRSTLSKMPAERFKAGTSSRSNDDIKFWGNFISDIDAWDNKFFRKSAREALSTDPQQRHLLQVTYQALQDSGYFSNASQPRDIGAYIGACSSDYDFNVASHPPTAYSTIGTLRAFLSGKISHYFGWSGPSLTFDTACSSSAVAIHTACKALQSDECSQAIAGGATLFSSPYLYENLAAAHFLSPSGATKPFDAGADGYCRGEGVGVVVLKRLDDAIADGDAIRGLIIGSAVNQNSNCVPITVPHSESQASLYRKVAKQAGLDPHSIDFVEAHGTGTPVGDPIEMESIREAFASATHRSSPLFVSSVKGAIGHLEGASGVAALIKAILQLEHREVVPQASFTTQNPRIPPLEPNHIHIPTSAQKFGQQRLTACVNNYGAAGSNATLMLSEAPRRQPGSPSPGIPKRYPIMLSAASSGSLVAYCKALDTFLHSWRGSHAPAEHSKLVPNLAYSLSRCQDQSQTNVLAFTTSSTDLGELQTQLQKQTVECNTITEVRQQPPLVLCFGGQGADSIALDRRVWESSTILRHHLDRCHDLLLEMGYPGIYPYIFQIEPVTDAIAHNSILFAMQYASAQSWIDAGLQVDCLVGHSLGQLTALSVSGILTLRDGLKFVVGRAALMVQRWGPEPGSMVVLDADEEKTCQMTSALSKDNPQHQYEIACYNGPKCHVVVSDRMSAAALIDEAKKIGMRHKALDVKYGFHSRFTDDLYPELDQLAATLEIHKPKIALESCTKNSSWDAPTSKLIAAHTRDPVYFKQAVQRVSERLGPCTWLEAGTNSTVIGLVARIVGVSSDVPNKFLPVALNKPNSLESLADTTVDLWKRGHKLQFWNFHRSQRADYDVLRLPPYQFEKNRHWLELVIPAPAETLSQFKAQLSSPQLPATLISLTKSDWQGHRFAINPCSPEFEILAKGHNVLGKRSCPPSIYVDLAARAACHVRRDNQDQVLPEVTGLQVGPAMSLNAEGSIELLLQPFGADWKFSLKTILPDSKYIEHASGIVGLQTKSAAMDADFIRFERLANRDLITTLLRDSEESLSGSMVYKVLSSLVDYAEFYRGVRHVCARGHQVAGKVVLPKELAHCLYEGSIVNSALLNYFTQVAGIYANFMCNRPEGHISKLSSVDVIRTGPSFQPLNASSFSEAAYEVLVYASPGAQEFANDIFVYDAATGRLVLYILGAVFKSLELAPTSTAHAAAHSLEPTSTMTRSHNPEAPSPVGKGALTLNDSVQRKHVPPISTGPSHAARDTKGAIHARMCDILQELADIRPADVTGSATFDGLGIDSLMIMEIVGELAKAFSLELYLDDVVELENMDALLAYLEKRGCGSGNAEAFESDTRRQSETSSTELPPRTSRALSYGSIATPLTPASEIAWQSGDLPSRLSALVCAYLDLETELHGPENLADLGFDSLVAIEITSDIRRQFSLVVDLEDLDDRSTFADLVRLVTGEKMPCMPAKADTTEFKGLPAVPQNNASHSVHAPEPRNDVAASTLFDNVRLKFDTYAEQTGFQGFWTQVHPLQSQLVVAYVVEALEKLGWDLKALSTGQKVPPIHVETKHKHLMSRMELILTDAGLLEPRNNSHFRTENPMPKEPSSALFSEMLARHPKHTSETKLLNITASNLAACLTGTADPLRLLFADPVNKEILADVYDSAPMCRAITRLLADYLSQILSNRSHSNEPFRICEVGAGTGATARHIVAFLETLDINFEYHFTDISGALVSAAKRKFRNLPGYDKMIFSNLDCNALPAEELRGKFDVVIATNCIHATPHASRSAQNVKALLKNDGVFCLVEFTRSLYWFDLVYGLLEGWWLFDDGRTHALADEGFWDKSLRDAAFGHVSWTDGDTLESQTMRLICAFP